MAKTIDEDHLEKKLDENLREFSTETQWSYLVAVAKYGSQRKAAKALGIAAGTIQNGVGAVKRKAAIRGYAPAADMVHIVPDPFVVRGTSTLYKDGVAKIQWVKTRLDDAQLQEAIKGAIGAFLEDVPVIPVSDFELDYQTDIIPWIEIGDAHLGMLAHSAETGENFDLKIAENEICAAISILIDELPNCERVVINDLGDFTHYENFSATTEASGHPLDFDSRFPKMIKVYSRVFRFIIERVLTKAKFVDVIVNQGNHSRTNDIWMAELLRVAYGASGRVNVLNNDSVFIGYRMGNTFVMTHHSDKCKPAHLANVMTTDFKKDYGETEYHYIDIGHIHHGMVMKEHPGISIESFNQLAALDKWAHDYGYRNRKSITVILRSRKYGEVGRRLLPIQEIRERMRPDNQLPPDNKPVFTV